MKRYFVVPLLCAFLGAPTVASAQEVGVFSTRDAEDVLADPPEPQVDTPENCPVPLRNGRCGRTSQTRGFSIAPPRARTTTTTALPPRTAPTQNLDRRRPASTIAGAAYGRPSAPRPVVGRAREVPLQFTVGSFALSPQSRANLQTLARALNAPQHSVKRIRISGHTDKSGSLEVNRRLSQQRADAVAEFLAAQGVDRRRIETLGRAYDDPLTGVSILSPRQRRVEVVRVD